MRRTVLVTALGLSLGGAAVLASAPGHADPTPVSEPAVGLSEVQRAALDAGDCSRCHTVPHAPAASRVESCHTCHVWIQGVSADPAKRAKALQIFPLWERYEQNVASYLQVPSLDAAMARLEPDWVRAYLKDPHDLRPNLPETMPRFDLSDAQVDAIVSTFESRRVPVSATPAPAPANLARGEALFSSRGCVACHTFGGRHTSGAVPLAPDLAHTRDRMHPDRVAAWIRDPQALSAEATMPGLALPEDELLALRDYVLLAEPEGEPAPAFATDITPTPEPVTWADVEARVFGKICTHCHMDPEQNQGRAGPGNAGGFGWAATGIELQTYEGVKAVADKIPAALDRRLAEAHRDTVSPGHLPPTVERPERPGMPLGLPPLSEEDHALVLGWIAQGMPRE